MISTLSKKHSFDSVFDSQRVFRLVLEAMSNPGRTVHIGGGPFLSLALTLLDNEVSFYAWGELSDEIVSMTLSKRDDMESADFIFTQDISVIEAAKCGTLADPHKSATVIIQNDGDPIRKLTLSGPGIDGRVEIQASQTVKDAITLRDAQNYEYPQGIDLSFVSADGGMFAVPRLVKEL
jgi:alpha-D-ribose 1-methylphosphonate 5-triphosphate synthase subunit PhnH